MTELEMQIGRTLGASSFFIFQTIKANPNVTLRDIMMETELSPGCVETAVAKLKASNIVERQMQVIGPTRQYLYKENKAYETWKFH